MTYICVVNRVIIGSDNVSIFGTRPLSAPMPTYCQLHQPWLWFITDGYLVKRWFLPAATRAKGQSNDLNREILASNLFNCCKEVINAPPVPSISRCIHIVHRHKNVWEYQWSNFIYNCMSTFLYYVHCKDALLDCSAPGGERCESLTRVDEIGTVETKLGKIWIKMRRFSVKKTHLNMLSAIFCAILCWPQCVLITTDKHPYRIDSIYYRPANKAAWPNQWFQLVLLSTAKWLWT